MNMVCGRKSRIVEVQPETEGGEDVSQMCDCPGGGGGMKLGGGSCGSSSTWLLAVKTVR